MLRFIIDEVKEEKCFSLTVTVDFTPDISHVDRLPCVLRYVLEGGSVVLKPVLVFFETVGLDIKNCKGQSYDNASNMSGKYGGLLAFVPVKRMYS